MPLRPAFRVILLAGLACTWPLAAHAGDEKASAGRGAKMVKDMCARCHAVGLDGESTHKEAPPLRDIANRYPVDGLAEAFAEGIVVGHPDMPEFKLSPDAIADLLNYMRSLSLSSQTQ